MDTAESSEGTSNIDLKNPDKYRKTVITFPATESYEVLRSLDLTDISAPVPGQMDPLSSACPTARV